MTEPARGRHADGPDRGQALRSIVAGAVAFVVLIGIVLVIRPETVDVLPFVDAKKDEPSPAASNEADSVAPGTKGAKDSKGSGGVAVRGHVPTDPGSDGVLSSTDLEPYVLRGSDLGFGWITLDQVASATQTLAGTCLRKAISPGATHIRLTTAFREGTQGPVISATVRDFTLVPTAKRAFANETQAVKRCVSSGAGPSLELSSADTGADATVATRFTVRKGAAEARGVLVAARVDQRTVTVIAIGTTQDDLDNAVDAARAVVRRLR